ncbi:porphobilinogen deaminase [Steccherinum ochraceum]|uniref:hydroxymethylbilane synthase n=1 Tax=Steccherinum ochraceum TaxID=92696 RepID=A0A4V2MVB4_9APHY|nr:porphobilinogen deaminase [Steccherinum ochraceum]
MADTRTFTLASRASQLAQIQTNIVRDALAAKFPDTKLATSFMSTSGDQNQSQALYLLGGKALWTKELEVALQEGVVDMLVHSYKDVPTVLPEGCEIAGVLEREDPVDSLVVKKGLSWTSLSELPEGSVVGTSSVRRVAQLRRQFSKLVFLDVRGNLNTRMAKLDDPSGPYTALILAKAGLVRLGWGPRITADLTPPTLYHAVSQGALAIEIRSDDGAARALCEAITHRPTLWRCAAERACLRVLEGGCSVPVGIHTVLDRGSVLKVTGCVTSLTGDRHVQHTLEQAINSVEDAEALGESLAVILKETGAKEILDEINVDREKRIGEAKTQEEPRTFTLASRASQLAQNQTNTVRDVLSSKFPMEKFTTSFMTTSGDHNQSAALYLVGGKEFWTKELEVALKDGAVDMLVHCYKDVPTVLPEGCEIAAVLEREHAVDSLVVKKGLPWKTLGEMPEGSVIGTSSVRRVAQLRRQFPKLVFRDARGNLNTRLSKLDDPSGPYTALVLAKAGLVRMGWEARITSDLAPPLLFPAVAQGALAIEIRTSDHAARAFCDALTHRPTLWCCAAERACLRVLEGGCSVPVGIQTDLDIENILKITGCVTSLTGERHVQHTLSQNIGSKAEAEELGKKLAVLLKEAGAKEILDEINVDREKRVDQSKGSVAQ